MNILLRMAFRGTAYHGFQVQQNAVTVCAVLQDAMEEVLQARPDVKGCSRTDAGVHAREFCLSFHHETDIPMEKLPLALNSRLPRDIRVWDAQKVPEDFHARYSALGKQYAYHILNSAVDDPFTEGLYYRLARPLNTEAMHAAAQAFIGRQDFASFQAAGSAVRDTVRSVHAFAVERSGERVVMRVCADGFLYNMVRIMAGTLLAVGTGELTANALPGILAARQRAAAGDTLPAKGLFLQRVFYSLDTLSKI